MAKAKRAQPPTDGPAPEPAAKPAKPVGIECRKCGCHHWFVVWVDRRRDGSIVRRRQCRHCGWQLTTRERPLAE